MKLRHCENTICPKQYVSNGNEPAGFWSRKKYPNNKTFWLCDECSAAYNKQQYCDYCKQVYFDYQEQYLDGKKWIGCDNQRCNKWNHIECEILLNNNLALRDLNDEEDIPYYCQTCSKNKKFGGGKSTAGKGTVSK